MYLTRIIALFLFLTLPIYAEDTAGSWAPTFTSKHEKWDVACDAQGSGTAREERCYIRYIDIYSPHPDFGVVFLFLEIKNNTPLISIGREFETDLIATDLRIASDWQRPKNLCTGGPCEIIGQNAKMFIDALIKGGTLQINFIDQMNMEQNRSWESLGFAAAYNDLTREAAARGL